MSFITRRKPLQHAQSAGEGAHNLKRTLGWPHLIALGVGAIIGTGIYTLTGVAAGLAGPAVILSFAAAGVVCAGAALCYAEMASLTPQSGSAYTYAYVTLGELVAWIVGVSLILEYTLVCSAVSVGWSGYATGLLQGAGASLPPQLAAATGVAVKDAAGHVIGTGLINLPAIFIALAVTGMLLVGTRESATVNFVLVCVKLAALAAFVAYTLPHFDGSHFHPFAPFGYGAHEIDGKKYGVMGAAAIIFFAFYGFDAISTAAEEAKNPKRDLMIGIVGSMVLCTAIYMVIAACALGVLPFGPFSKSPEPLAFVLKQMGQPGAAAVIAGAAVLAMPTVIMVFMFGQSRVFFSMARDGLLPPALAKVDRRGVPAVVTVITGVLAAIVAGVAPLDDIASAANAGTLAAFIATAVAVMILRRRAPELVRPFKAPAVWLVAPLTILGCLWFFSSLRTVTMVIFLVANAIGLATYLLYGRTHSRLEAGDGASGG